MIASKGLGGESRSECPMRSARLSCTLGRMFDITFRLSGPADEYGLARLAALDGARPLDGPALVAEADSRLLAALPLGSGRAIADPFEPTADIVALLELEKQRVRGSRGDRRRGSRLRSLLRGRLSHAGT